MKPSNATQTLINAFHANNYEAIVNALQEGADPDVQMGTGKPLLSIAINQKSHKVALLLLESGASIFNLDRKNETHPWMLAIQTNSADVFLKMWEKNPTWANPESFDEKKPFDNPWVQMSFHPFFQKTFLEIINRSQQQKHRLPAFLSDILAQQISIWESPTPTLEAILPLVSDPSRFFENVAWNTCAFSINNPDAEKKTWKARAWAMEKGASFMRPDLCRWQEAVQLDGLERSSLFSYRKPAVLTLCQLSPMNTESGIEAWAKKWGAKISPKMIDLILKESISENCLKSFQLFWGLRTSKLPWSKRFPASSSRKAQHPLPHHAAWTLFNNKRNPSQSIALFRNCIETGHELYENDDNGDTVIHTVLRRYAVCEDSQENASRLNQAIELLEGKGFSLSTLNRRDEEAGEIAKKIKTSATRAIVARWEAEKLSKILPEKNQPKKSQTRIRM